MKTRTIHTQDIEGIFTLTLIKRGKEFFVIHKINQLEKEVEHGEYDTLQEALDNYMRWHRILINSAAYANK